MFKGKIALRLAGVLLIIVALSILVGLAIGFPTSVEAANRWPTVKQAATGRNVVSIQLLLKAHGASLSIDGDFGPQTASAVRSFQSKHGLSVDGIVGSQTWSALVVTTRQGNKGSAVIALQHQLNARGYNLDVDGDFGPLTNRAVRQFQNKEGISVDGIAGPQTWQHLVGSTNSTTNPPSDTNAPKDVNQRIVYYATAILNGEAVRFWGGGKVPYSWAGGHSKVGPTLGSCDGYSGSIHPCPANKTVGVDCSGFTRWVYYLAYNKDVLGSGSTGSQLARMHLVPSSKAEPGDLIFFASSTRGVHHVGVYIGHGKMINAPYTGSNIAISSSNRSDAIGYYRY